MGMETFESKALGELYRMNDYLYDIRELLKTYIRWELGGSSTELAILVTQEEE